MMDSESDFPKTEQEPSLESTSSGRGARAERESAIPRRARKRGMGPLAWVLLVSGAFFVLFMIASAGIYASRYSGKATGKGGLLAGTSTSEVGVIELNGVIMDSKKILKKLEDFEESPAIKGVVLRLNSPGGAVAPSQEIYQAVKNFKKPLVVSMGSVAASGAYYIAMGAKKVYANPGTITGSIGVIMEFADLEKLYEWAKIRRYSVKTGKFKDVGAEYREMSPEEHELLQNMVDDVLSQFKQAVSDGRKLPLDHVTEIADGRIFSGSQAKNAKLVDELGTLNDAIDDVAKQAGIKGKPEVVYPEKNRPRWLDLVLDDNSSEERSESSSFMHSVTEILSGHVEKAVTGLEPGVYWLWSGAR